MTARCECSRPSFWMLACLVGVPANPLRRRVLCGNISEMSRQGFDWVDGAPDSDETCPDLLRPPAYPLCHRRRTAATARAASRCRIVWLNYFYSGMDALLMQCALAAVCTQE
jgi:hypothetical protein